MKKTFRIFSIFLCLILSLVSFSGCNKKEDTPKTTTKLYSEMDFNDEDVSSGIIVENDNFSLTWDDSRSQIFFTDKKTGAIYGNMPYEATVPTLDEEGNTINNNPQVESPVTVYYYEPKSVSESNAHASVDAITDGDVYTEKIENGIRVTYDFYAQEISVPVDYTIAEDRFNITVNPTEISDNGEKIVTGVAIAPFICGVKNDSEDASLFLPDGSGAVVKPFSKNLIGYNGSIKVYGNDLTIQTYDKKSFTKTVKMPVFGMQKGENALFAIITSAAEQAEICWNIGAGNIRYSTVYPMFRIRGYSLLESPKGFASSSIEIKAFDDNISKTPLTVSYYTLNGEKANYSGMAEVYRNYLLNNGTLVKKSTSTPAASFKVIGGIEQRVFTFGVPHTSLKALTTIKQAQEMTEYFRSNIKGDILVNLVGFGTNGLEAGKLGGGFKIDGTFGDKKDIKSLSDYSQKNDVKLFYNFDLIAFGKSGNGFSLTTDSAKLINGQTAFLNNYDNMTRKKDGYRYALLSRSQTDTALNKAMESTEMYDIKGISLDSLANTLYSDYSNYDFAVGGNTEKAIKEILEKANKKLTVLNAAANSYAFSGSDYITDAPSSSSKFDFTAYDVPFYQMVVKGYVPLTSESINLAVNSKEMLLACAETGMAPSYTLIYDYDSNIANSKFYNFYGSSYKGIKEDIVKDVNKLSSALTIIGNKEIVKHTVLEEGVRITEFAGGVSVIVNGTDKVKTVNGKEIAAMDYTVLEG